MTRETSNGFAVCDFAELVLGEPLLPWQRHLAIHGMELNPDGTYRFRTVISIVARQNGKTHFVKTLALWRMFIDGAALVMGAAQTRSVSKEAWQKAVLAIEASPELSAELAKTPRLTNGDEEIMLKSGSRYRICATTPGAGRGYSVDHLIFDEIRQQDTWTSWAALSKTTNARPFAQIWAISNAGDDNSVVLNGLRESALAERDPSIGLFEWSAADGCALDDPIGWCQANPALGYTLTESAIRSALGTDPPNIFRTEILSQRVKTLDGAVDEEAWESSADPTGSLKAMGVPPVICIDAAPDGRHVTAAAAAVMADGRIRVETVGAWNSLEEARSDLVGIMTRNDFAVLAWFPQGPAAAIGYEIRNAAGLTSGGIPGKFGQTFDLSGATVMELCQAFSTLVTDRRLTHGADPLMTSHVIGAKRLRVGDGWRFQRKDMGNCDAAYAAAGAVHVARMLYERSNYDVGASAF